VSGKTFAEWAFGVPPAGGDADGFPPLPEQAPTGRDARNLLAAQQLEELRVLSQTAGAVAERLQGRLVDHVIAVGTNYFDPSNIGVNYVHQQFKVAVGAVKVRNLSMASPITVAQGGPSSQPPTSGRGIWIIPANTIDVVNVMSTDFTIWGTAGDRCSWQAWSVASEPR
jgi:hypothetical protein